MTSRTARSGVAFGAGLAFALSAMGSATAVSNDVHPASDQVSRHAAATTRSEQQQVKDHWVSKRMLTAVPMSAGQTDGGGVEAPPAEVAVQEEADPRFGK